MYLALVGTECFQFVFPQIAGQAAGPGAGGGEEDDTVFLLLPLGQIPDQELKGVLVGVDGFDGYAVFFLYRHAGKALLQAEHEERALFHGHGEHSL